VDIMAGPGRLFLGDRTRAEFLSIPVQDLPAGDTFDMVLLVDVLHHVPPAERTKLLALTAARLRPGGLLVVKDWERGLNPAHLLCYLVERFISGDSGVRYFRRNELATQLAEAVPTSLVRVEARVPPRRNNLLLVVQRTVSSAA
jgi:2-polyprenyl-6-hydroxyphenyl methylase/3-demethylubiquinone-9 3-methyltransferase